MLKIIIGKFGWGKIICFHRLFLRSYCCTDDLQFDKFSRIRVGREIISSRITFFIRSFLKSLNNISFAMNSLFFPLSFFLLQSSKKFVIFLAQQEIFDTLKFSFILVKKCNIPLLHYISYIFQKFLSSRKKREIFFLEIVSLWISVERYLYLQKRKISKNCDEKMQ